MGLGRCGPGYPHGRRCCCWSGWGGGHSGVDGGELKCVCAPRGRVGLAGAWQIQRGCALCASCKRMQVAGCTPQAGSTVHGCTLREPPSALVCGSVTVKHVCAMCSAGKAGKATNKQEVKQSPCWIHHYMNHHACTRAHTCKHALTQASCTQVRRPASTHLLRQ